MARTQEFHLGVSGPSEASSLMGNADSFNGLNPRKFRANGLNQPYMKDPKNGNSKVDALRQTPEGQLPSSNGMSQSTYQSINPSSFGTQLGI